MANSTEGWLSAAACRAGGCPTLAPVTEVRFRDLPSPRRRELAALVVAGFASTALMLSPLMVPADGIALPTRSLPIQFAAAPTLPTLPVEIAGQSVRVRRVRQPRVLNTFDFVAHRPSAQAVRVTARADNNPATADGTARGGRIARVLFGDGRYHVRPFPSPAGQD